MANQVFEFGDAEYVTTARSYIESLVSLENRFGAADLVDLSVRFFNSLHDMLGTGSYARPLKGELNAIAGELAEIVGWLAYDTERHGLVRRMNQESLHFTRLAGDRHIELLTIQNAAMHAGALGRPHEALQLTDSVLGGGYELSPRLRALFLTRQVRARAQAGDGSALDTLREVKSLFLDGVQEADPQWLWWVDERELAWHEAMVKSDLGIADAVDDFNRAVEATGANETRNQYLHRAYLLHAQVKCGVWSNVEENVEKLSSLAPQVASLRSEKVARQAIAIAARCDAVPDGIAEQLTRFDHKLSLSSADESRE